MSLFSTLHLQNEPWKILPGESTRKYSPPNHADVSQNTSQSIELVPVSTRTQAQDDSTTSFFSEVPVPHRSIRISEYLYHPDRSYSVPDL